MVAPFDFIEILGKPLAYGIFLLIGIGFGSVLESSGFGDSRKLSAQFYLREMTVLKVMFTAIITACVLIFLSASMGWLDFSRVWVNTTYLWPGIVGGLIMGVGFIIGGFCPGTSLVAAVTLKLDGLFFVFGVIFGVFLFGETVDYFEQFFLSSNLGRFQIHEWLGLDLGLVILLVLMMAYMMFWAAEICEQIFGQKRTLKQIQIWPWTRWKLIGALGLVLLALVVWVRGEPGFQQKWSWVAEENQPLLDQRNIYVHPMELIQTLRNPMIKSYIYDLRPEEEFNLFHLQDAENLSFDDIKSREFIKNLKQLPANSVLFLIGSGEALATQVWKYLKAERVINVYVLEGGVNHWLKTFGCDLKLNKKTSVSDEDQNQYEFHYAYGDRVNFCYSQVVMMKEKEIPHIGFEPKIKIQVKKQKTGGCG